jgi:hypothetical protein
MNDKSLIIFLYFKVEPNMKIWPLLVLLFSLGMGWLRTLKIISFRFWILNFANKKKTDMTKQLS